MSTGTAPGDGDRRSGWASATRELAVAAGLIVVLGVASALVLGPATASIVVLFAVALAVVAIRVLIGSYNHQPPPPDLREDAPSTTFVGFWRTQNDLADSVASMSAWDFGTRRRLANLLAARLAERHGISLAADPKAARQVFIGSDSAGQSRARAEALWYWIDPARPSPPDAHSQPGIPPRDLAALIHRLEQL